MSMALEAMLTLAKFALSLRVKKICSRKPANLTRNSPYFKPRFYGSFSLKESGRLDANLRLIILFFKVAKEETETQFF
jgi:hypothetical protein